MEAKIGGNNTSLGSPFVVVDATRKNPVDKLYFVNNGSTKIGNFC